MYELSIGMDNPGKMLGAAETFLLMSFYYYIVTFFIDFPYSLTILPAFLFTELLNVPFLIISVNFLS